MPCLVSDLNKKGFFSGIASEGDKPIKVPILVCDAQWDTGPNTTAYNSVWVPAATVLDVTTDRLLLKPALGGGALYVSGTVELRAPDPGGGGGWVAGTGSALSDANLVITNPRADLKQIRVSLPASVQGWVNTHPGAEVRVVNLVMKGAKGPYLESCSTRRCSRFMKPPMRPTSRTRSPMSWVTVSSRRCQAGEQVNGAPNLPTQYISYDLDGMSTGSHCNHATNKCVMYQSGPIIGSYNRYCDDCHPYLLSIDMSKYG